MTVATRTTTVVLTTSLRFGHVTFFISAVVSRTNSLVAVHHSLGRSTSPVFSSMNPSVKPGRPRGARTPNLRFWRPLLYQLSYWPLIGGKSLTIRGFSVLFPSCHPEPHRRRGIPFVLAPWDPSAVSAASG